MADQSGKNSSAETSAREPSTEDAGRGPAQDLAEGLELMLRAARKAVKSIDQTRLEELGRRAFQGIDTIDRQKVQEFGKKAAQKLDPRHIEQVAEDAGREILAVVERVAERIDGMLGVNRDSRSDAETASAGAASHSTPYQANTDQSGEHPKVRVDTKS